MVSLKVREADLKSPRAILYYVHDPMCSWCWGFQPAWKSIQSSLVSNSFSIPVDIECIVGGLAPDSDELMPDETKVYVKKNWERIQKVIPNTEFNYDFWTKCQPRRSTYPACRAVLAARMQGDQYEAPMIEAIQSAYYLEAKNPSDMDTLLACAQLLLLDVTLFQQAMISPQIEVQLQDNLRFYQELTSTVGIGGFPSLALALTIGAKPTIRVVPIDYNNPQYSVDFIRNTIRNLEG